MEYWNEQHYAYSVLNNICIIWTVGLLLGLSSYHNSIHYYDSLKNEIMDGWVSLFCVTEWNSSITLKSGTEHLCIYDFTCIINSSSISNCGYDCNTIIWSMCSDDFYYANYSNSHEIKIAKSCEFHVKIEDKKFTVYQPNY